MASPVDVADVLRQEILRLQLLPGAPLREVALAERFDCSRRSVREALLALHADRLVVHERHRGASVRAFTEADVRDLYRVRELLEAEGAASCAKAGPDLRGAVAGALEHLRRSASAAQDSVEHALDDMAFHASVVELAGSPRLSAAFSAISREMVFAIRLLQRDEVASAISSDEVVAEHEAIAAPVLAGDGAAAVAAVREHAERSRERLASLVHR